MKKKAIINALVRRLESVKDVAETAFSKVKMRVKKHPSSRRAPWAWRVIAVFFLFFVLFLASAVRPFAYGESEYSLIDEEAQGILDGFADILPEGMDSFSDPKESSDKVGIKFLLGRAVDSVNENGGEIFSFFVTVLGFAMLSSLASLKDGELGKACRGGVSIVSSALIIDTVFALVDEVGEALSAINSFYSSLIPVVGAVNLFGLSASAASSESVGMTLTLGVYSFLSGSFLYSFVGALSILAALSPIDGSGFGGIAQSVKRGFLWSIGLLTAFIGATFSLQSIISSYADSGALRGAKYAVSGMIPIVGGSISGALAVLISGFSYLKGAVGGGGIAVIISLAAAPLFTLLLYRAAFALAAFITDIFAEGGVGGLLSAFGFALDSLIAVYSLTTLIYVIQLVVFLKGGASVA